MESAATAPPRGRGPLLVGPREIYGREYQAAPHEAFQRKLLIAPHELYEYNRKFLSSVTTPPPQEHEPESMEAPPRETGPLLVGPQEIYGREYQAVPHEAFQRKLLVAPHELYEYNRKSIFSSVATPPPPPQEHVLVLEPVSAHHIKFPMGPYEFYLGKINIEEYETSDDDDIDTSFDEDEDDDVSCEEEEFICKEDDEEKDKEKQDVNVDENHDKKQIVMKWPMHVEEYETSDDDEEEDEDDDDDDISNSDDDDTTSVEEDEEEDGSSEDEQEFISEEEDEEKEKQNVIFDWVHVNIDENNDKISGWTIVSDALDLIDEDEEKIENQQDENTPSWMRLSRLCPNLDMID